MMNSHIKRTSCVICSKNNWDILYTFIQIPIFMGCQYDNDIIKHDQTWLICKDCGCIFLNDLIPLNILYKNSHNGGIGRTWDKHYKDYANYIVNFCGSDIIEIGAGNCRLASNLININKNINEYCIFENNNLIDIHEKIKHINCLYNPDDIINNVSYFDKYDTIITSHFVEHMY